MMNLLGWAAIAAVGAIGLIAGFTAGVGWATIQLTGDEYPGTKSE